MSGFSVLRRSRRIARAQIFLLGLPPDRPCTEFPVLRRSCFFWRAVSSFERACVAKLAARVAERLISEGGYNKPPNLLAQNGKICARSRPNARSRLNAKRKGVVPGKGHALFATSRLQLRRLLAAKSKLLLRLSQLRPAVLPPRYLSRLRPGIERATEPCGARP